MSDTDASGARQMYLPPEDWSPRYDSSFFTARVDRSQRLSEKPPGPTVPGNAGHPAWYYRIRVFCEHRQWTVLRRYSQFRWLHQQLRTRQDITFQQQPSPPSGTCFFHVQNNGFVDRRRGELNDFLDDTLRLPGNSSHPSVRKFLNLDESHG